MLRLLKRNLPVNLIVTLLMSSSLRADPKILSEDDQRASARAAIACRKCELDLSTMQEAYDAQLKSSEGTTEMVLLSGVVMALGGYLIGRGLR